uniref:BZIP domain-containing protein n=2 Tax=Steinernema glaseri TaxID=37863 RepID=A0A1I7ZWB2_9BILA
MVGRVSGPIPPVRTPSAALFRELFTGKERARPSGSRPSALCCAVASQLRTILAMSYYPPQPHPYYYAPTAPAGPAPGYFNPYSNFGLPAPQLPQVSAPPSAINDSGFSSPPASSDECDKENAAAEKAPSKAKQATMSEEEQRKYREKRDRNNLAAKVSRQHRKLREQTLATELREAKQALSSLQKHHDMVVQAIHAGAGIADVLAFLQNPPTAPQGAAQGFTFF